MITVGVLTLSDRCAENKAVDESGPYLVEMIRNGILGNAEVVKTCLLPDSLIQIENKLKEWSDVENIQVIITTGGTGIASTDVTTEATIGLLDKKIPGIPMLMFKRSSEVTPLAALSRAECGVRRKSLIVNLPGSKKAAKECLESIASVIPHAVDLICENKQNVEAVHCKSESRKSKVSTEGLADRPRESPYPCLEVYEAQNVILKRILILRAETTIAIENAFGLVLAQDVIALEFLPPFDVSLKDGYAVLSSDQDEEKVVIDILCAGSFGHPDLEVKNGCCARISTGAAIPKGADAVVQVEDTTLVSVKGTEEDKVHFSKMATKGQDIRPKGSDFGKGDILLETGTYLGPSALGLLAAAGVSTVRVFAKPTVAIFSTGDELITYKGKSQPGKIRDSNRIVLLNTLRQENFPALDLGMVADDPDALCDALEKGFRAADVVVTTGSMSMGDKDYLKKVLVKDFDAEIEFGRVFMKPGKPTAFAVVRFEGKHKVWFGLPGNPASAAVTTQLFLLPGLKKASGYPKWLPEACSCRSSNFGFQTQENFSQPKFNSFSNCASLYQGPAQSSNSNPSNASLMPLLVLKEGPYLQREDRPNYLRGVLTCDRNQNIINVKITGKQNSSRIGSCVNANCLVEIPPKGKECHLKVYFLENIM